MLAEAKVYAKLDRRLLPLLFFCYVAAYLDRVNVGFAKLQMMGDLGLSDLAYGTGAGIFFIGYFLFEVPSNLILAKVGARRWIARIMIGWGLVSCANLFVRDAASFYLLRFLLGLAEAGFFPGIVLYLTYWYPAARRARIVAIFMSAVAVAGVVGGPLSGWIMARCAGLHGLAGWQWLFLLEGLPSIVLGVAVLLWLDDRIADARWLTPAEQQLLTQAVAAEARAIAPRSLRATFADGRVWALALVYFCFVMGLYGVSFWLPQLLKNAGAQDVLTIGLMTAVPWCLGALAMIALARRSDRLGERRGHVALAGLAGAAGLLLSTLAAGQPWLSLAALSLATAGILATLPIFWSLPTAMLSGAAAAAGIALINSFGNLAGFLSPFLVGAIREASGSTSGGMLVLAAAMLIGAAIVTRVARP
ncbi:MFS transporter [Massilia sp. TS11]|uniref:MFS transporter n=1 Tax=Massilia sp. TS11 TaxID=2908003 RepID=UPI001EDB9CC4|nr:MFS transporter [Massilia sp. TS11]MCG2586828.1 MFS transporter [Massilia sp. TS11]